jgi:hypothetical protein
MSKQKAPQPETRHFARLRKSDLDDLAAGIVFEDRLAIDESVEFVLAETRGLWHGRARAKMCRHLKHCQITKEQQERLVTCILGRLSSRNFSEQFYDQLRYALHVDQQRVIDAARQNLSGFSKDHVKRYSLWVLEHH